MEQLQSSGFDDGFNVDLSDKMQIVDPKEKKPLVHTMSLSADEYEIISYFLSMENGYRPFYIVDLSEVRRKFIQFKRCLPNVRPFYAIKSNPDQMLLDLLAKLGCGFDCASKAEIILAKATGISPELLLYANPTKDNSSLEFARAQDVDKLTFDSSCELDKIKVFHPDAECIIRIKVDDSGSVCKFSSKFGCGVEDVRGLLEKAKMDEINVVGCSFHQGSNCKVLGQFKKAIRDVRTVFDIGKELGFDMKIVDIGGGFPGYDDNTGVTFEMLAEEINASIEEYFGDLPNVDVIAEPGRFMCASSHTLVTTVTGIKTAIDSVSKEKEYKYTINEGVYNSFNCIIFDHAKPQILPFNERTERTYNSIIMGQSCDSIDVITSQIKLPKLAVGDKLFVQNFGAYTRASSSSFNGFSTTLIHYIVKM